MALVVAGYAVVVVNGAGTLRGFHNVCRHRSGPLVWDGTGTCRSLVCRYRGWSYSLAGDLRSARDFGAEVPVAELSLLAITVEVWRGLLFVNLDGEAQALIGWLGAVVDRCTGYHLEGLRVVHLSGHDLAANWKVYAENYQEGCHIPLVHPGLHRQVDSSKYEVELIGLVAVHSAPTRDGAVTDGAWLWRFPGFAPNLYRTGMSLETYWPTGPTSTRVEYTFFADPGQPGPTGGRVGGGGAQLGNRPRRGPGDLRVGAAEPGASLPPVLRPRHENGVALVHRLVNQGLG